MWVGTRCLYGLLVFAVGLTLVRTAGAQVLFQIDPTTSGLRMEVDLETIVGSDSDSDSTGLSGTMTAMVKPESIHIQEGAMVFADSVHLAFSIGGIVTLGTITADASPSALQLAIVTPGPPATLSGGAFEQQNNLLSLNGTLQLDGTGAFATQVPEDPQEIEVESALDLAGTLEVIEGHYELTVPIDFIGTFDLGSNAEALVQLEGLIRARSASPVSRESLEIPLASAQVYPSPATSQARIRFSTERSADVRMDLYDAQGRHVRLLESGRYTVGDHEARIDVSAVASGVYFVVLTTGSARKTVPLTVMR